MTESHESHLARKSRFVCGPRCGRLAWRRLVVMAAWCAATPALAATCSVSTPGVTFGTYDVFSMKNLDGVGNVAVTCDMSSTYTVALSPGGGSFAARTMASGASRLGYNLYSDATRVTIWGDGTGGTATVSGTATTANLPVYGRIPARQNLPVGGYSDSIIVTLTF